MSHTEITVSNALYHGLNKFLFSHPSVPTDVRGG
jgi:hypothetical protein